MIVDHSHRLHVCVDNGRSDEGEAALFEIAAEFVGLGGSSEVQQLAPAKNQHCVTGDVLKKSSSRRPTFCSPDVDGWVPSLSTSPVVHTNPSERPAVPRVHR